jgi:cytochrome c biogenesis factor
MMESLTFELAIVVIAVIAAIFVLLAVFYPLVAYHLGLEEGTAGQRFLSLMIGLALFALILVYRAARSSIGEV